MRFPALLAILASAAAAHAQPLESRVETTPATEESPTQPGPAPTTVPAPVDEPDWNAAPSPRDASGVAREDARSGTDRMLWIPRSLLFLPRMAVWLTAQPIRGAAYAYERYDVPTKGSGSGGPGGFSVYPTAAYESGFGFTLGGRLIWSDIVGEGERMKLRADFFGRFSQAYGVNLRSGERFGKHVAFEVDSSYERRPRERFFGIGNGDDAIASRFRETRVRNALTVDTMIVNALHARTSGALVLRDLAGTDDDDSITMQYDTSTLVGFDTGVDNLYVEEELVYDTRRPGKYQSKASDVTGWYAAVHAGVARGVRGDPSKFYRYGGEVERYFDLYDGSRVLMLRALVEVVDGDNVSFVDLPRLGGGEYLRGYPNGRFRDRAITLGTAEYNWDLGNFLAAFTFVDVGRPFDTLSDVEADGLRVGFGGGIQVQTGNSFLARMQIAGSRDGDFFFDVLLSPRSGRRERAGRYE